MLTGPLAPEPVGRVAIGPGDAIVSTMSGESDEELMLQYAQGDARAFEVLYQRHRGPLFRYVSRQVSSRAQAEELFQDVWTNVIRNRERYEVRARFTTWLYRIAHNRLVDSYREAGRHPTVSLDATSDGDETDAAPEAATVPASVQASAERQLGAERAVERLRQAIDELPADQREAFLLQEETDLTLEDIARLVGVGRETIKSRLRYASAKLRAAVSWQGPEGK